MISRFLDLKKARKNDQGRGFSNLILVKPSGRSSTQQNSEMISCSTTLDCCLNLGPTAAEFLFDFPPLLEWIQSTWDHLVFSLRFPILLPHSIWERSPVGHPPSLSDADPPQHTNSQMMREHSVEYLSSSVLLCTHQQTSSAPTFHFHLFPLPHWNGVVGR